MMCESCSKKVYRRGLCSTHYRQWRLDNAGPCSIADCTDKADTKGLCTRHYARTIRGIPMDARRRYRNRPFEVRLREDCEVTPSGCIEWSAAIHPTHGYGVAQYEGKTMYAHRAAWMLHHGPIPDGLYVLHSCDNPPCVNIDHLRLGTAADNTADMMSRGRHRSHRLPSAQQRSGG